MTNNDSIVEQIVRSLSFEVVAVPTEKVIQSSTSKSTPLNVRIKVKKKADGGLQHGILATPTLGPDGVPQRLRLVSSDHTIMSFNVVMEDADFVKPVSSRKLTIPNLPIHPDTHDGTYDQTSNQTYKADMKESRTSQSDGALKNTFTLSKVKNNETLKTSPKVNRKDIFGKCKPGGCLDPPFGEDKYSYEPANESLTVPNQDNVNTTKPRTSSIFSNKLFKKIKKTKPDKSSSKPEEQDSILSLYQGDSLKSVTLSNSLITYPSTLNESDIKLLQEKQKLTARNNYESMSKKSIDVNSGSLYIIPKKNKISIELKDPLLTGQKENKPDQNLTTVDVVPTQNITNSRPLHQTSTDLDSHKELEVINNVIKPDQQADDELQNNSVKMLPIGDSIDEPDNAKQFQPFKEVSETYGINEDGSLQNLYAEIPQDNNDALLTDIMSSDDLPIIIAEKEKLGNSVEVVGEIIQENLPLVSISTELDIRDINSSESAIMKEEIIKTALSKSAVDKNEILSLTSDTKKSNIGFTEKFADGNVFNSYRNETGNEPQTTTSDVLDGNVDKDLDNDYTNEVNKISSDNLQDESSRPVRNKVMPLKGQGLGEEFNYDDINSKISSDSLQDELLHPESNKILPLKGQGLREEFKNDDLNTKISSDSLQDELLHPESNKIVPLQGQGLREEFKNDGNNTKMSSDSLQDELLHQGSNKIMPLKGQGLRKELNNDDINTNVSSESLQDELLYQESNKIMPLKGQDLIEEVEYDDIENQNQTVPVSEADQVHENNTKSGNLRTSKLNSIGSVDVDLQRNWKSGKEIIDFNITIDDNSMVTNKENYNENVTTAKESEQEQTQDFLNTNIRDPSLNDDTRKTKNNNEELKTNNDDNYLSKDMLIGSPKSQSQTDIHSIVGSKPEDQFNIDDDFLKDQTSNTKANKQSNKITVGNDDKKTLARADGIPYNEKPKSKDVKKSDSQIDQYDTYGTSDNGSDIYIKKALDSDNASKRSKTSVSFDDMVLNISESKKLKKNTGFEKPIKIDLGFHSYTTDNNEVIIKSFDSQTVLDRHPKDAIIMASCNVRDPFEMKVPIDNDNLLCIQIKNKSKDDTENKIKQASPPSKYSDRRPNSAKSAMKTIKGTDKYGDESKLSEVYENIFENELVPLQETIKRLRQEVDGLIYQQNTFKENLLSKRVKQFKLMQGTKRCCCSRKL